MSPNRNPYNRSRLIVCVLVCASLLAATTGVSCDDNADADFRQTATQAIGDGLKTIASGLIDGWVSAVVNAGDGSTTGSQSTSSGN